MKRLAGLVALAVLLPGTAAAQELLWFASGVPGRRIGSFRTCGVGDITGDGYEDILTIVDEQCGGSGVFKGLLWFLSGSDGAFLREVPSDVGWGGFASIAAAGDMNADGVPDYVAGQGYVSGTFTYHFMDVRSGIDDAILWSVPGTLDQVLSDLDVNGDGLKDLVVGDWHLNNNLGEVRVYAHKGHLLYTLLGDISPTANPPLAIASQFASLGDVDDDGCDDFAMACLEPTGRGATVVVSGRTGAYLRVCYGELPGDNLGFVTSECGDLDHDGYRDFVAGNRGCFSCARGVVRAFSSRTGAVLHQWVSPGPGGAAFSFSLASRGVDLDGDSLSDVLIGEPGYWAPSLLGAVHAYSGRDGSRLHFFNSVPPAAAPFGQIGAFATVLRPPPGEHTGLMIVPNPISNPYTFPTAPFCGHSRGSIAAYRGTPRTAAVLGPPCAGNLPDVANIGLQTLPSAVRVHLSSAPPNGLAVLMFGLAAPHYLGVPLPIALDPLGLPGCWLRTPATLTYAVVTGSTGNNAGYAFVDLPHPIPTTGNLVWHLSAQWLVLGDPTTFPGGVTQAVNWWRGI